ncbi:MAG: NTP transferase domain-containing protein [Tannerellaceae bacterium]|jgi:NDP-sugar pyrophosphorylase family protein|nr:NTP transferase domain-containing protein [Tannerellaceae bacterium]
MDYAIIAAGAGSRLVQEGVEWPKPLVRLNGISLIDRLIDVFLQNDATSINVIVNEEMKEVQAYLGKLQLPVPYRLRIKSTRSSMHSFFELKDCLQNERFCLATVDAIFKEEEFRKYIQSFLKDENIDGLMAVTDYIDDEKPLYVNTDQNLCIKSFSDKAEPGGVRYISGGVYCLKRTALKVLDGAMAKGMSKMRNYQRLLIEEGLALKAYPFSKIVDVDHAGDIVTAERFLNA